MTRIHVSPSGEAGAAGTAQAPLRTIAQGIARAASGDTVLVRPGTYAEAVVIDKSITLQSETLHAALIRPPADSWNAVSITANEVVVDGFDIQPRFAGGDGIEGNGVHHVTVLNNLVHGAGESGIQFNWSEFLTIEGNECHDNAHNGWFSGISVYQCRQIAGDTTTPGYRTVIRGNKSHHNLSVEGEGGHADGNGIIVDDMNHTQETLGNTPVGTTPPYPYPALVENNVAWANGGKGIVVFVSDRTMVRFNTVHGNLLDPVDARGSDTWRGQLHLQSSSDCTFTDNVAVHVAAGAHPNGTALGNCGAENARNTWARNVGFGSDPIVRADPAKNAIPAATNRLGVDPQLDAAFVSALTPKVGWQPGGVAPAPVPETALPSIPDAPGTIVAESAVYELGTRVRIAEAGTITGLRLWRANASAQEMRLWRDGAVVATASIPGGAAGWAEAAVTVPVAAGDELIVSVGKGARQKYPADAGVLAAAVPRGGYTIPANGGVFATVPGTLPTQVYASSYYWTDIAFEAAR